MNYPQSITAILVSAAVVGCARSSTDGDRASANVPARNLDNETINAGLDPTDDRIVALVSWLKGEGITLEHAHSGAGRGEWKVTHPKMPDEYDVMFSIRSFPSWASEEQMRDALHMINLAYILNAPAHLAMSFGGCAGTHPEAKLPRSEDELPKFDGLPITKAVQQLFCEYEAG